MRAMRRTLTISAVLLLSACVDREPTLPSISAAKGGAGGGEVAVDSTNPSSGPQDSTLNVRIKGANFDMGSRADWALSGVVSDKVRVNSTTFVSSKELVANITIAADAAVDLYDVIVTASTGKKGIGSELFAVRAKGQPAASPSIAYARGDLWAMNFDGSNEAQISAEPYSVVQISWAATGTGTAADPWHLVFQRVHGCGPGEIFQLDVAVIGGQPQGFNRTPVTMTTNACDPAWSPASDTIAFGEGSMPTGTPSRLFIMSLSGGVQIPVYSSATDAGYAIYWPSWSPDGSRIGFVETGGGGTYALKVHDRRTGQTTTILEPGTMSSIRFLDWARTRDAVAFTGARPGDRGEQLFVLELAPLGSPTPVGSGAHPSWSPHDTKLVYQTNLGIESIDLATKKRTRLAGSGRYPSWRR